MKLTKITAALLRNYDASSEQVELFRKTFPKGAVPSPTTLRKAARAGLCVSWWAERVLPPHLRAEYRRLVAPIWAEFERQEDPFLAEWVRQLEPFRAECLRRLSRANEKQQEDLAWAEYKRHVATLKANFEQQAASLRAKYERQVAEVIIGLLWPGKEKK